MKQFTIIKLLAMGILLSNSLFAQEDTTLTTIVSIADTNYNENQIIIRIRCNSDNNIPDSIGLNFGLENHDSNSSYFSTENIIIDNYIYDSSIEKYTSLVYDTLSFFHSHYKHFIEIPNQDYILFNKTWLFTNHFFDFYNRGYISPYLIRNTWGFGYYYDTLSNDWLYGGYYGGFINFEIGKELDNDLLNADYIGLEIDFNRINPDGNNDSNWIGINKLTANTYENQFIYDIPEDSIMHISQLIQTIDFENFYIGRSTYYDNLFIYPVYNSYICEGDSIEINGSFVFDEGVYIDSLFTSLGTDSIVGINLKFNDILHGDTIETEFCEGDGYIVNDTLTLLTEGLHEVYTTSVHGCDSIFYIDLEEHLNTISTSISNMNNVLTYDNPQTGYTYQWINLSTNQEISGETSYTYSPSINGNYAIRVSDGVCEVLSNGSNTNIGLTDLDAQMNLFPNPFSDYITLEFKEVKEKISVIISDVQSKVLLDKTFKNTSEIKIEGNTLQNGIYNITISDGNISTTKKLIRLK